MKQLKITKFPELDYAGSEAFNTLSTNLSFAGETVKKIMITSCHASEGKSYLSMNLMRTLAQRGMKVALVDADLRRSVVNAQYGLQFEDGRNDDKGLSHFLAGMVGMEEVIYQTDIPGALMVPVGRDVPNPLALLSNHHFKDLLDALAQRWIMCWWTPPLWAWSLMLPRSQNPATAPSSLCSTTMCAARSCWT